MEDESIKINFSDNDLSDITGLLNELLKQVSLVLLSKYELSMVDLNHMPGLQNNDFSDIVKTINRFGIRDDSGEYYKVLNDIIARISLCNGLLQIYEPIQLLLFNKLLFNKMANKTEKFLEEEIAIFFSRYYSNIICSDIYMSGVFLYDLVKKTMNLKISLISQDSQEYLGYGICRRLFMLKKNVDDLSDVYREDRVEVLSTEEDAILDQAINAIYANIYAILDCLAFVIAFEDTNYKIDRNSFIGLRKVGLYNKSFIKEYPNYSKLERTLRLDQIKPWYNEICDLRHPVAHRIPLYFPPGIYNDDEGKKYIEVMEEYNFGYRDIFTGKDVPDCKIVNKLTELSETRDQKLSEINLFSGCFQHSEIESQQVYHISRLIVDLGIIYFLLSQGFSYIKELVSEKDTSK